MTSDHYSGNIFTGAGVLSVNAEWYTETASATAQASYSSTWVGIDAYQANNGQLIQIGTESDYVPGASQQDQYYAWYQTCCTNNPYQVKIDPAQFRFLPGDQVEAEVIWDSPTSWHADIQNLGSNLDYYGTAEQYTNPAVTNSEADFILERTSICSSPTSCYYPMLADYGSTTFSTAYMCVNGFGCPYIGSVQHYDPHMFTSVQGNVDAPPGAPQSAASGPEISSPGAFQDQAGSTFGITRVNPAD